MKMEKRKSLHDDGGIGIIRCLFHPYCWLISVPILFVTILYLLILNMIFIWIYANVLHIDYQPNWWRRGNGAWSSSKSIIIKLTKLRMIN